jgi:hypothetical protein
VVILDNPYPEGPFGAKGLGELPIDGPAPAVVNAIRSLGIDVREAPATPEIVMLAARGARDDAERLAHALAYSGAAAPAGGMEAAAPPGPADGTRARPDTAIAAEMGAGG